MRAVVQRVRQASVEVEGRCVGKIEQGLLVYLGVQKGDAEADGQYIARKLTALRIFDDAEGRMNLSVKDAGGSILLVSQFTLCADARKGARPDYFAAAPADEARAYYERMQTLLREHVPVETGIFQAEMLVSSVNDGPVTILLDSKKTF